ncbi:hypothetical protein F5890DRAFT_1470490 [Lentinula detonsa]|uniref:Uncharacterized protein n=1 Tax=Lentinula detonsa TaxID=2804962 RepID=A0AA38QAT1_9AGAR|nr:hypothetical protein F5890DRAFT_1470490 [Lentinula detonsa]
MGPPRNYAVTLSHEKDQEVLKLKLQSKAYAARTSLLQSRLTATQNALDSLQLSHDEALRAEQSAKRKLQQQLKTYHKFLESVNYQKDDLRNAVESFLQRVQDPNITWPQSQLRISSLLEPADPKFLMHHNQDAPNDFDERLMKYAAAMIGTVVYERDLARKAHDTLLLDAKAQIAALESELARRDLELEKCASHCVDCPNFRRGPKVQTALESFTPMDSLSLLNTLQKTSARHSLLEQGNRQLERQLQQFRQSAAGPPTSTEILDDSTHNICMPLANGNSLENTSSISKLIPELDKEVQHLSIAVQAFALERDQLQKMVAEHAESEHLPPVDSVDENLTLTPMLTDPRATSATHLHSSESNSSIEQPGLEAKENLEITGKSSHSHALNMLDDNTNAKEDLTNPVSRVSPYLLDAEDGEVSMELATPLLPTTFLSSTQRSPRSSTQAVSAKPNPPGPILLSTILSSSSLSEQARSSISSHSEQSAVLHSEELRITESLNQPGLGETKNEDGAIDLDILTSGIALARQRAVESPNPVNDPPDHVSGSGRSNLC